MILELLLASCPQSKTIQDLASAHGIRQQRFKQEHEDCILCGLCVRYCAEIKKANAIGFIGRGVEREVAFLPEVAPNVCPSCGECLAICPSGKLVSEIPGGIMSPV